jgi:hypothetical protein
MIIVMLGASGMPDFMTSRTSRRDGQPRRPADEAAASTTPKREATQMAQLIHPNRYLFAAAPVQTSRYRPTISSAVGTRGLFAGLPEASACSAINAILPNHAASLIP